MPIGTVLDDLIQTLVASTDKTEILAAYKAWSSEYDEDLNRKGYVAPILSVDLLKVLVKSVDTPIYDAGCGTGKVGALLSELGYQKLTGADFSDDMLGIAKLSSHYIKLTNTDFTKPIEEANNSFGAAISVGVYHSQLDGVFLAELARIVEPGGVIVLSCRPVHYDGHAKADIDQLVSTGLVRVISKSLDTYMAEGNSKAWYVALAVL